MSDLYDSLVSREDVECVHPKFIGTVDGKKDYIAEAKDGEVYLTDFGREFLAATEQVTAKAPKRATKKAAEEVQSANMLATEETLEV